jgi:hypothetical protein
MNILKSIEIPKQLDGPTSGYTIMGKIKHQYAANPGDKWANYTTWVYRSVW